MRSLRKYTNNRGSALFMVISTMTALMISCMAMYFAVISSRSTQYAIFNQQQSKQSASSINDAVIAGMMDGQLEGLTSAMTKLKEGERLSAGANGFKELGLATGIDNNSDLGAYTMDIVRLPNETVGGAEKMVFDITTTSVVNGSNSVYHTIIYYEGASSDAPPAPAQAQVFAATGYVPNDVFVDGGNIYTDTFFDNEMTIINGYGTRNLLIDGNVSTGGSLEIHGTTAVGTTRPLTFAIRNNLTFSENCENQITFYDKGGSMVLVGGDCTTKNGFGNADVYVLGDLYVNGNIYANHCNYYVNGNVILGKNGWYDLSNIYCNKKVNAKVIDTTTWTGGISSGLKGSLDANKMGMTTKSWDEAAAAGGKVLNVTQMSDLLNEKTQTNTYYKWVINDSQSSKDGYVRELNEGSESCVKRTLKFSNTADNPVMTVEMNYSDSEKGCIIEDVTLDASGTYSAYDLAVVIDTGEDEDNVYTIRVKANRDLIPDKDNKPETFSWLPENAPDSCRMTIIVKGRGSVVIDIPEGVTYQDESYQKFLHYGWFVLGGGTEEVKETTAGKKYIVYNQNGNGDALNTGGIDKKLAAFVHRECKSGDGCEYTESTGTNKCSICGTTMEVVTCKIHGKLSEFCPKCQSAKSGHHEGECVNHVGRSEIDAYLAKQSESFRKRMQDSKGKTIYPSTNIFLKSCAESANIRLSIKDNGDDILQNSFFGYIYAPYMTFKASAYADATGGNMVRLFGGMTVSDYVIDDCMSMVGCWPDHMPNDLMSDECKKDPMQGLGNKSWKIDIKAH